MTMLKHVQQSLMPTLSGEVAHYADMTLHSAFQTIISLNHAQPIGYEALVRATKPDGHCVSPIVLFDKVKDEADLVYLDRLCRALHLCNFVKAQQQGLIFLNVNPVVSIRGRCFGSFFEEFLNQVGLSPDRVVIEILEGKVLDDSQLADSIAFYRERGCLVAIDDFGVGHSNFGRIWRIKPHIVKLDRSNLTFARSDKAARRGLPRLVDMLQDAGCQVVMEGIEDEFEAMLALESGADFAQGYYFGRPSSEPNVELAADACRILIQRYGLRRLS